MKMKSTIIYKKWEIVLVSFPFMSKKPEKKRPALIVSPQKYNESNNIIILQITGSKNSNNTMGYEIKDWHDARLLSLSIINMKFATIKSSIIIKKLGKLSQNDINIFKNYL